tara:strand:- start:409 stop:696 length:288 start_codon:yes stop_codon:yes gene_type:complete
MRRKKPNTVYLLKSGDIYKYGCTSNVKNRINNINSTNKKYGKFELIAAFQSKKAFQAECKFKYFLWDNHTGLGEFFQTDVSEDILCDKLKEVSDE